MKREKLEKYQVLIYLAAIACGLLIGTTLPNYADILEHLLWPVLGLLLYAIFTQIPLAHLRKAFGDRRFASAAVIGNFVIVPLIVCGLLMVAPEAPEVRLGILFVLLVPCTDWFITFTHLGGGDTKYAIAFTPISLLLQIILLPFYAWLFLGADVAISVAQRELLVAFLGLIALPLLAALITEKWAERGVARRNAVASFGWLPVPLLALVVFTIAATQAGVVKDSVALLGHLFLIFVAFLVVAALISRGLARVFGLPATLGRVLAFSLGSRNSFVVSAAAPAFSPAWLLPRSVSFL